MAVYSEGIENSIRITLRAGKLTRLARPTGWLTHASALLIVVVPQEKPLAKQVHSAESEPCTQRLLFQVHLKYVHLS